MTDQQPNQPTGENSSPSKPKSSDRLASPLKAVVMTKIVREAVALEYGNLWNPNGPISRSEAFHRVSAGYVQGLSEAEAKRLLADELAYVAEQELMAAERQRRKKT
ncbi:MAG: hypothetical protein AB1656_17770 [Candidatus Omnitrophota bacterium]